MRRPLAVLLQILIFIVCLSVSAEAVGPKGDLNGDGDVNLPDLRIFAEQWLDPDCSIFDCSADLDISNTVDMVDFAMLAQHWYAEELSPVISEFMAINDSTLEDPCQAGQFPDWIEIYNPTDETVNLDGWYLTDNDANLVKWQFPAVRLDPGRFLVVFASGDSRREPGKPLHMNFKLDGDGEYLALVAADGKTVVHEYAPVYPAQLRDISYGLMQYATTLVAPGATVRYYVPYSSTWENTWMQPDFDDLAGWQTGEMGLGFGFGGTPMAAYNDCVYRDDQYIAENVTTYDIGSGHPHASSGPLVDQATGEEMGITVTLTESGGVNWQPDPGNGGSDCATGTDAYETFGGITDMTGVIYYGSAGWWIDIMFEGLDPTTCYTFATSAARNNYDGRLTVYTISGADTYANASTPGVDVLSEDNVRFNTGNNHNEGYVARWTGITAADGSFKVRAEADPSCPDGLKAYSFDVFKLEGGFRGTEVQSQMQGVNPSIWTRIEFDVEDPVIFDTLKLRMKYEDGFVAYINGQEVARRNVPDSVHWNSAAKSDRPIEDALVFEEINLMPFLGALRAGRNVLAIQGLNDGIDDPDFLILPELVAATSMGVPQYFTSPTPGTYNVAGAIGRVSEVWFSHERGFYTYPFQLTLSTDMQEAEIRYTLDGSRPAITHGTTYTGPIDIPGTTVIRAVAVRPGFLDSDVETHTYIFVSDVITQSPYGEAPGPGWPTGSVNGQIIDYGMDPDVMYDPAYASLVDDALTAIPTISLVTDLANLFNSSSGIYVNAGSEGRAWERPVSVELIYPSNPQGPGFPDLVDGKLPADMRDGFQIDAGMRIRGGYSVSGSNPKHAFRLFFRAEYGQAKLRYPLFGDEGVDEFDHVDLRTSQNYSWAFDGSNRNTFVRDVWSRDVQGAMGQEYTRSRYYHLYINGQYWGLFQTQERSEASHGAAYFGGDKEDYDVVSSNWTAGRAMYATDGNLDAYRRFYDAAIAGLTGTAYLHMQGLNSNGEPDPNYERMLDVDNQIDYMIIDYFTGDRDGPGSRYGNIPNNTWSMYNRKNPDGWKWFQHDSEHSLGTGEENLVTPFTTAGAQWQYFNLHWLNEQLANNNIDYRLHFADHVNRHFFAKGRFTSVACQTSIQNRANQISMPIIAESARWGDSKRHPPYTKDTWQTEVNWILYSYLPTRTATVLNQFKSVGWYPNINAPTFSNYGGLVPTGFPLIMSATSGTIYYTQDGSDPRVPAVLSSSGPSLTLVAESAAKRVFVPTEPVSGGVGTILREYWTGISGTSVSDLTSSPDFPGNPTGKDLLTSFEAPVDWAENYGTRIRGYLHPPTTGNYTFWIASDDASELWLSTNEEPANKVLIAHVPGWTSSREWNKYPEQQSASISLNATQAYYIEVLQKEGTGGDSVAVTWQGPGISYGNPIPGQYLSPVGDTWATLYFDDLSWPSGIGGVGYETQPSDPLNYVSLIAKDVQAAMYNHNTTCYIRIPFTYNGNPMDLNAVTLKVRYDDGFIAFLNGTEVARRNFSGIPQWDSVANDEHPDAEAVNFEQIDVSGFVNALQPGNNVLAFQGLNLSVADPDFLISAELVAQEIGQGDLSPAALQYAGPLTLTKSIHIKARVLDGSTWSPLTEATYVVGPVVQNLRITEIMYHPQDRGDPNDPNEEFIELKNIGTSTINLNLVRFSEGIYFTLPSLELEAGEYVVVVKDQDAFEAKYGTGVNIAGEYTGSLANDGERIRLETAVGLPILDFEYKDGWRDNTDGEGFSLTIIYPTRSVGTWSDQDSWRASAYMGGSPGEDDSGVIPNPSTVVINEVLAHSHLDSDWIELYNAGDDTIDIGGWYLSDSDVNLMKYRIADDTEIEPGHYKVFYENQDFNNPGGDPGCFVPFALSENGEVVRLSSGQGGVLTGYREREDFGASETGISFGRYYKSSTANFNFVAMDHTTERAANADPKVGPIVISEIMYNPATGNQNEEYIELYNISGSAVTLFDYVEGAPWKFTDGIEYTFPASPAITIPAGGYLLLVKHPTLFSQQYPTVTSEIIVGPYDGRLSNAGEKLELSKPGDLDEGGMRYYIRVDRVNYSDGSHPEDCPGGVDLWPTSADGHGFSLTRKVADDYGNDVANWQGNVPSPGE